MARTAAAAGTAVTSLTAAICYRYRPRPYAEPPTNPAVAYVGQTEPPELNAARHLVFLTGALGSKFVLNVMNRFELKQDERYDTLLQAIQSRPAGQALITLSNHTCTLDDPTVISALLPLSMCLRPRLLRWVLGAQEICFKTEALSAYFGAAKVLPILRGAGLDQLKLLHMYQYVAAGDWCHIFPEGRCEQTGGLGGREGERSKTVGKLKWGVGKLIAHAPTTPLVIPFYHTGMQNVIPLHPVTRKSLTFVPQSGHVITCRVGRPLDFSDLLEEHEKEHAPLRKIGILDKEEREKGLDAWRTTAAERLLYSRIAWRVQRALEDLEQEARAELGPQFPGRPVLSSRLQEKIASS